MLQRLLGALAILAGKADGDIHGARRIAHQFGFPQTKRSSGRIRAALDLAGMPAFNEYRCAEELANTGPGFPGGDRVHVGDVERARWIVEHRQARNAAKCRRRALRT